MDIAALKAFFVEFEEHQRKQQTPRQPPRPISMYIACWESSAWT
jgi:hypothetical protein